MPIIGHVIRPMGFSGAGGIDDTCTNNSRTSGLSLLLEAVGPYLERVLQEDDCNNIGVCSVKFTNERVHTVLNFLAFLFKMKLLRNPMYQLACTHAVNLYYVPLT
jgi:hypothetical protein